MSHFCKRHMHINTFHLLLSKWDRQREEQRGNYKDNLMKEHFFPRRIFLSSTLFYSSGTRWCLQPQKNSTSTWATIRMLIVAPSCQERWRDSRRQASALGEVGETMETGHYLTLWVHLPRPARLVCAREHQNWQICQRHPALFTDRSRFSLTIPDRCERIWRCRELM